MKPKNKITYTDEPKETGWEYDRTRKLNTKEMAAIGLPLPRKAAKEARINIRLSAETLSGLRERAEDVGMPYQTFAASILHLVAKGRIRLDLVEAA